MKTPAPSTKPRFNLCSRHGQLHLVIRLAPEVEDVQALPGASLYLALQKQLSRGVVAAAIHDIAKLAKLKAP